MPLAFVASDIGLFRRPGNFVLCQFVPDDGQLLDEGARQFIRAGRIAHLPPLVLLHCCRDHQLGMLVTPPCRVTVRNEFVRVDLADPLKGVWLVCRRKDHEVVGGG